MQTLPVLKKRVIASTQMSTWELASGDGNDVIVHISAVERARHPPIQEAYREASQSPKLSTCSSTMFLSGSAIVQRRRQTVVETELGLDARAIRMRNSRNCHAIEMHRNSHNGVRRYSQRYVS